MTEGVILVEFLSTHLVPFYISLFIFVYLLFCSSMISVASLF